MKQIITFLALVSAGCAIRIEQAPRDYSFTYNVNAPETGDQKYHSENREGGVVTGSYASQQHDRLAEVVYRRQSVYGPHHAPISSGVASVNYPVQNTVSSQVIGIRQPQQIFTQIPNFHYPGHFYQPQYENVYVNPYYPVNQLG